MDGKGGSLPSIPEPVNPISMKQLPEVLGVRKGRGDMNGDPATLLMDKAAAHLAATLHDSVLLQKMASHNNHNHERLKDLTSRVLNGDQDKLPKLCAPEPPILKAGEAPATTGNHQWKCPPHSDPEFNVKITQMVKQPQFEPCCADGTGLVATAKESIMNSAETRQEVSKKRKRRPHKPKPQPNFCSTTTTNTIPVGPSVPVKTEEDTGIADEQVAPVPEVKESSSVTVRFSVGDVVWTKVSGYPWWPCMVTTNPEFNQHIKPKQKGNNRSGLQYHVQYFGDAPERGYIFEKSMVTFSGEEQYQELCSQGTKQSASRVLHKKTVASVPCKLRAQWNMGIVQAKEATSMSLDDRMTTFAFAYDDDGPHLNPHVLEKLRPEQSNDKDLGDKTDSRLSPTLPELTSTSPAASPAPVFPRSKDSSTSTGKKTQAPRGKNEKRERKKPGTGEIKLKLSKEKAKAHSSSKDTPQPDLSEHASKDATTATDAQKVPPKKQQNKNRKQKQQPLAPSKMVGKKNKSKSVSSMDSTADSSMLSTVSVDKVKKGKKKTMTPDKEEPKIDSTAKKVPKKSSKRPLIETMVEEKDQQPKKKRKMNKDSEKQKVLPTEGTTEKKQKNIKKADKVEKVKKLTKKSKAANPGAEDQAEEKPKRKRKKADGQTTPTQNKKSRPSPCPEPEVGEVSGSEGSGCPDSPSDSLDGIKKGERNNVAKKEFFCQLCEKVGEDLVSCEGPCYGKFHLHCLGLDTMTTPEDCLGQDNVDVMMTKPEDKILCKDCSSGVHSCFSCKKSEGEVRRCHVQHCGKFYHEACVRLSHLTVFDKQGFRCPLHICLSCHYSCRSNPTSSKGKMMRCMRCPVAYHTGDLCMAAGSEMITNNAIICTNHFSAKKGYSHHSHVNVSWCFVCSKGGQLLCCESCPAAFHPECLNIAMPDGSWFCNDCRAGKKPKYKDIVWVKLGTYRWWPAEIQHPRNIPTNIQHLRHEIGEFPVKFFGSKDYFWTHQGRVFPYMEGDRGSKYQRSATTGKVFKNALLEAEIRFKEIKLKQEAKEAQENNKKPPPYKFIKVNKPCGKVQVYTADISEIPKCNCKPSDERPCGFESECLNRMLLYECHPEVCPNGERCCNQDFTKRLYPETKIIKAAGKGWGLVSLRDIKKGEFVNEYIGELIDEEECHNRIRYAQENNITHFYMLTIHKDRIIDAGPKGNYSRFMNHSCQPNCETQKWTVNGDTRVGLFAVCDIPAGTELTFNYNLDCLGNEKTVCRCGAPNCSGFLGDRPKNSSSQTAEPKGKKVKKKLKKKKSEGKKSEDECFRCSDGGQLVLCGKKTCAKAYHLSCLGLTKRPFGRWDCPWHHCDVCGKNSEAFCQLCPNSFCKAHQEGALRPWPLTGQLCCMEHEEPSGTEDTTGPQTQAVAPEAAAAAAASSAAASRPTKGKKNSRAAEAKAAASSSSSEPAKRLAKGSRKKQGKVKAQAAL